MSDSRLFQKNPLIQRGFRLLLGLCFMMVLVQFMGCSESPDSPDTTSKKTAKALEERWGVRPVSIRLTGAGHFLDFRYQITDPDKAAGLLKRDQKAFLVDQETGKEFPVPVTKLGPLRSTAVKPKTGRHYVILFSNVGKTVKKGGHVTVVIGEFRAETLTVE
jgi:hypothetical protein